MKVGLTGFNGFLATKLRERTEVQWIDGNSNVDILLHLGSPTFTDAELDQHDAQVIHQYVRESIRIIDRFDGPILFASTTGVDDIQLDHKGSTSYNLGKLYLENYIINNCDDKYLVLRIGTIISNKLSDVRMMRLDRVQQRILRKDFTNIPMTDCYLDVNTFVEETMDAILTNQTGILDYSQIRLTLPNLIGYGK